MTEQVLTLVVDDDAGVRFFLEETLRRTGHTVVTAASGEEALDRLQGTRFEVVLLDLRLGGRVDGMRVLEAVKWRWPETVVVILTGHGSLESAVAAIREGIDGYLLKPVEPDEVRRVVSEALRKRGALVHTREVPQQERLQRGILSIDLKKHTVTREGRQLDLTPQEFALLGHLVQNADRVISPTELVRVVRQYESDSPYEAQQVIKWYIHRLRRKVEPDPSKPRYVLNVRGVGYRFGG